MTGPENPVPPDAAAPRILVLGLGNDILTDDAVGLQVARTVQSEIEDQEDIAVAETTEMGLALLDAIAGREGLVLIDAIQTGRAPAGHVHEVSPKELGAVVGTSPHFLGVGETLALGRALGLPMPTEVRVLAIEVADPLTLGETMTPAVAAAVPSAAARAIDLARTLSRRRQTAARTAPG